MAKKAAKRATKKKAATRKPATANSKAKPDLDTSQGSDVLLDEPPSKAKPSKPAEDNWGDDELQDVKPIRPLGPKRLGAAKAVPDEELEDYYPDEDDDEGDEDEWDESGYNRGADAYSPVEDHSPRGVTIFPQPPNKVLEAREWKAFRDYWRRIYSDPVMRRRLRVYGYRTYPVLLEGHRNIYKLSGDEAKPLTLEDIAHRYGAGSYNLKLNDRGPNLNESMQVCQINLTHSERPELADFQLTPPALDPADLDEDNPANDLYFRQKRIYEHRHGDMRQDEEEEKAMREKDDLSGKMFEALMSERRKATGLEGSDRAIELVAHAAQESISMIREQAKQAAERGEKFDAGSSLESTLALVERLKADRSGSDSDAMKLLVEVMKENGAARDRLYESNMTMLQGILDKVTTAQQAAQQKSLEPPANPNPKQPSMLDRAQELRDLKEAMEGIFGKGGGRAASGVDWQSLAPVLVQAATPLLQSIQQLVYLMAVKASGQTGAPPPPSPEAVHQQLGTPGAQGQPQGAGGFGGAPGGPAGQGSPQGQAVDAYRAALAQQGVPPQQREQLILFMEQLKGPLVNHLRDPELNGEDFADFFVRWRSEAEYQQLAKLGADNMLTSLKQYPPIWSEVAHREAEMQQFVGEFIHAFDPVTDGEAEAGEGESDSPAYRPSPPSQASQPPQGVNGPPDAPEARTSSESAPNGQAKTSKPAASAAKPKSARKNVVIPKRESKRASSQSAPKSKK